MDRRRAYFALAVLFAINMMNFFDRQIIAVVTEPVRKEWQLTYSQMALLGTAFFSRQMWGWISDRIGGLTTVLLGSIWQFLSVTALSLTQDEIGLFTVAAVFGLGFSGIIPAYALCARELFPAREAGWRIPVLLFCSGAGMASGGWFAGLLYDHFGYYAPAFAAGLIFNAVNLVMIGTLVARKFSSGGMRPAMA